jgi:hypothetical protein
VTVGCRDFRFGDHPIRADQPEKECGYGEGRKTHLRIRHRNSRGNSVSGNGEIADHILTRDSAKFNQEARLSFIGQIL